MTTFTLRLRDDDLRHLEVAAEKLAGPIGKAYVSRTDVIRHALVSFIERTPAEANV